MPVAVRTTQDMERLMELYGDRLLRLCCMYLNDEHLAQDAVQDTFVKIYRAPRSFDLPQAERNWVTRVAINTCKDYLRSAWKRHVTTVEQLPEVPAPQQPPADEAEELYQAVQALKPKYRQVVLLHYYEGLRVGEIAQILQTPQSTISIRLRRARQMLHGMLGGSDRDEDHRAERP